MTSDDVHGKQFTSIEDRFGYDKRQVAAFLEAAGIRLAAMESTDRPEEPPVSSAVLAEWALWADSTRFSTTRGRTGGHDTTEVDAFREKIRDTFLREMDPRMTSEEANGKKFRLLRHGYDVEQVDDFFDEAEARLAEMRRSDKGNVTDGGPSRLSQA